MMQVLKVAFRPPSRSSDAGGGEDAAARFAVLPQNTSDELVLSEVHSKLDRALNFLQRDVGYALLDDARPRAGGAVSLARRPPGAPPRNEGPGVTRPAAPRGAERSLNLHQDELQLPVRPEEFKRLVVERQRRIADLELRLASALKERDKFGDRIGALKEELLQCQSSIRSSTADGVLEQELQQQFLQHESEVQALQVALDCCDEDEPEASASEEEVLVIGPEAAKYAHCQDDLILVSRFVQVLANTSPSAEQKVKHDALYKTVLQGLRLMHLCDYDYADIVLVLAHAAVYFRSTYTHIGHKMSEFEAAHVCVLLIYLAHAFILDETCPLRCWQKYIFRRYCTLKVLDQALFRLFHMRGFILRVSKNEEREALRGLASSRRRKASKDSVGSTGAEAPIPCCGSSAAPEAGDPKEIDDGPSTASSCGSLGDQAIASMNGPVTNGPISSQPLS